VYVSGKQGYTYYGPDGAQRHSRGDYLILASSSTDRYTPDSIGPHAREHGLEAVYACIRRVALAQLGHFMMGHARIGGFGITLSGAYGNDSLPLNFDSFGVHDHHVDQYGREKFHRYLTFDECVSIRARFVRLPDDLSSLYWADQSSNFVTAEKIAAYVRGQRPAEEIK